MVHYPFTLGPPQTPPPAALDRKAGVRLTFRPGGHGVLTEMIQMKKCNTIDGLAPPHSPAPAGPAPGGPRLSSSSGSISAVSVAPSDVSLKRPLVAISLSLMLTPPNKPRPSAFHPH